MNDLEYMYILKENGYEPTFENLTILKEGLDSGEYVIDLEEGFHPVRAIKTYRSYSDKVKAAKQDVDSARHLRKADKEELLALPKDKRAGSEEEANLDREVKTEARMKGALAAVKAERRSATMASLRGDTIDNKK